MKTPQEKAKELISLNSLSILSVVGNKLTMDEVKEIAKQFALSELDEILGCIEWHLYPLDKEWTYFEEVQEELEKL
jgi:hypothetical protein